jgi:hypothetical protein
VGEEGLNLLFSVGPFSSFHYIGDQTQAVLEVPSRAVRGVFLILIWHCEAPQKRNWAGIGTAHLGYGS